MGNEPHESPSDNPNAASPKCPVCQTVNDLGVQKCKNCGSLLPQL